MDFWIYMLILFGVNIGYFMRAELGGLSTWKDKKAGFIIVNILAIVLLIVFYFVGV